jgi:hypothetical protein
VPSLGVSRLSVAPAHPSLQVTRRWGLVKKRRMLRVNGVSPPMDIRAFNSDIDTLESAVKERVFYVRGETAFVPPPKPEPGHFVRELVPTMQRLSKLLPCSAPLSRRQFVDLFRGRKRAIYENANRELLSGGLSDSDSHVKVFVKYEKTCFTRKADPVPRVISPRSPKYNIELGRFLRPVEERIYKSLAGLFGHITVFKGMNASQMGRRMSEKWGMFTTPVAIGLDASRFDQHVSVDALKWEGDVYLACFPDARRKAQLRRLLTKQHRNRCTGYTADGKLRYVVDGGRMSGDINTSLGNCLLMCAMVHAYAASRGIKVQLANNGDDCVVIMEAIDLAVFQEGLNEWFLAMGFAMCVEPPVYCLEEIEFCQTHPVRIGLGEHDFLMVRHPRWAIAKDTMCTHPYQTDALRSGWVNAVGVGGLSMTGGVPIFQDFYDMLIRSSHPHGSVNDGQSWGVRKLAEGLDRNWCAVLPETRASFYWAFGVTPDEQVVIEECYRGMGCVPSLDKFLRYQRPMPL